MMHPFSVIPAKAGIQSHKRRHPRLWAPAFAGVTNSFEPRE
jgi:hypothetical protein